ncbi:MAG: TonB-dependent siderophore receptor [Rhodocyclales bacterium]|nr:TonB-dependent siderophore receptor [Rhodocyclales bacterium]
MPYNDHQHPFRPTLLAAALALTCHTAFAQGTPADAAAPAGKSGDQATRLPEVKVRASAAPAVTPGTITSTTKGETRALETPQSITVITREKLDQTQVKSLVEALSTVAGVVAGERGRRGFDDFGIRGQVFGQEKYIDGLNTVRSGYVPAEEIFGAERVEVLKGPASLLFGNVRPGGLVNVVSKRPKREAFGELGVTVGNLGFREVTADVSRPLSSDGRSALRVAALGNDSDDATDHVFFKNKYIAPSFSVAVGERTDLTVLTSYQEREWLRNQGLAPKGTVLPNKNGRIDRSLFIGDPSFGHNDARRTRVGYELQHRFGEDWKLQQNFRWDDYTMTQRGTAFHGALAADERTQSRTGNVQHDDHRTLALDTYVNGRVRSGIGTHELTFGLDLNDKHGRLSSRSCTAADLGTIDLFAPTYGRLDESTPCTGAFSDNTQDIRAVGVYARDHLRIGQQLHLTFGARHDRVTTRTFNEVKSVVSSEPKDSATTGMLGLVYEVMPGVAPYASVANSFVPLSGTDADGKAFEPETGKQIEAGVKFERDGGRQVASIAVYDLKRRNVTTNDPVNAGFSVQQGEHHSRGLELELAADLRNGWSITGAYAYTDAEVSKSNKASEVGRTVNNVPRHSVSVWGLYRVAAGPLEGWGFGLGLRHASKRTGYSYDFSIPGYTVFDAAVHYQGKGWRAALNVRNLADKTYYGGALSNSVVTLGDTRQVRLNLVYEL